MLIPTRRRRSSLLLAATLAAVAVVPIWQAAAEILRHIDDTSNNSSPSHININDETHHSEEYNDTSGGIRGLRKKKKKKKNSMSRSKSHKSAKHPKAKEKKKNVFGNKDTTEEDDNNTGTFTGTIVGDDEEEEDNGMVVGDEEEVIITCNGCATCTDGILGATATATNDKGKSDSYTCKERIQFLMTSKGGSMSEFAACTQVGEEFPTICGSCTPCCTQEQEQECTYRDIEAGRVCTSSICILEEYQLNCDTLIKHADGTTCLTYNPLNPEGTCDNGDCIGKCSAEDVALCNRDVNSCTIKACTIEYGFLRTCGDAVSKADGTTCKPSPCKEEGTCSNGVCTGGSDLSQRTTGTCGTNQYDDDIECCNGQCCTKDKSFCCRYLFTNDYTW